MNLTTTETQYNSSFIRRRWVTIMWLKKWSNPNSEDGGDNISIHDGAVSSRSYDLVMVQDGPKRHRFSIFWSVVWSSSLHSFKKWYVTYSSEYRCKRFEVKHLVTLLHRRQYFNTLLPFLLSPAANSLRNYILFVVVQTQSVILRCINVYGSEIPLLKFAWLVF